LPASQDQGPTCLPVSNNMAVTGNKDSEQLLRLLTVSDIVMLTVSDIVILTVSDSVMLTV
jgi:hypothetical protein